MRARLLVFGIVLGLMSPGFIASSQPKKVWRIGYIEGGGPATRPNLVAAFKRRLNDLGYDDAQYTFDPKYAEGRDDRLAALAAEILAGRPDAVLAVAPQPAFAVAKATSTVPIVFVGVGDPVGTGLVASLAKPGGNVTGLSVMAVELTGKRLELLKEVVPTAKQVGVLVSAGNPVNKLELKEANAAAAKLGLVLHPFEVRVAEDFASAFAAFTAQRADAVFVLSSPLVFPNQKIIADSAVKANIPTVCALREYALAGCLIAYGPKYVEHFRRAAEMIDLIFKGSKPADLPVEQPTRFEHLVNLRTAKALRLSIQESFLLRADEVIE
jgi:putative tryptophan/tyrosine transport system substrate-binding protein